MLGVLGILMPYWDASQATQDVVDHLPYLISRCLTLPATRVLELGTARGDSTRIFAKAMELTHGKLWTIDINPPEGNWQFTFPADNPYVTFIRADSRTYPWHQELDALFIDSGHTYLGTLAELDRYAPWVRQGGILWLHDIHHQDPEPGASDGDGKNFPVVRALLHWMTQHEFRWSWIDHGGRWGLGEVIVPISLAHFRHESQSDPL